VPNLHTFCFIHFRRKKLVPRFELDDTIRRQYSRYNAVGTQLTVRLLAPSDNSDPVGHFLASVNDLFVYTLQDVSNSDMVGKIIYNHVNQNDKPVEISFRKKDQLSEEVFLRKCYITILDLTPWKSFF